MGRQEIGRQCGKCVGWPYFYEAKKGAFRRKNSGTDQNQIDPERARKRMLATPVTA